MEMKMLAQDKHCLLIGGGVQEVEAVRQLQQLGWIVGVSDRNENCACSRVADYLIIADGRDPEHIVQSLIHNTRFRDIPKVVFTLTELSTTVSIISAAFGLFSASIQSSSISQSKAASKKTWKKVGISTPDGAVCSRSTRIDELGIKLNYPMVVKPDVSFGGKGLSVLDDEYDYSEAVNQAIANSKTEFCIIEEKINGTLHDANALFSADGHFHPLSISDRSWSNKISVEKGIHSPSRLSLKEQTELLNLFESACRAIGLNKGPVKIDAMFDGYTFYVLEVAARLHGPRNSVKIVPATYGKDLIPEVLNSMRAGLAPQWSINNHKYIAISEQIKSNIYGEIVSINGMGKIKKTENIIDIEIYKSPGQLVNNPSNSSEVIGYIFAVGEKYETCTSAIKNARKYLDIQIANN